MSAIDYEPNPDWVGIDFGLDGWEPWEPDEEPDREPIGCHYCDSPDTRIDPFAGKPCCDGCFNELIGGDRADPPFRCATCAPLTATEIEDPA